MVVVFDCLNALSLIAPFLAVITTVVSIVGAATFLTVPQLAMVIAAKAAINIVLNILIFCLLFN